MLKERRLRRREDFKRVLSTGRAKSDVNLVLKVAAGTAPASRTGIVTSKKIGGAVERNRVRRRLREILRPLAITPVIDMVFIARLPAKTAAFSALETSVRGLLKRSGLITAENEKNSPRSN